MSDLITRIHLNCVECADCMVWQGPKSQSGIPRRASKSLRRIVYEAAKGPVQPHLMVSVTCEHSMCLNPEHMKANTKGAVLKRTYATTDLASRRSISSRATARKRAKLNMDKARAIRASDETIDVLAGRYGVDRTLISQIRRGTAWKDASPFAGLGAR